MNSYGDISEWVISVISENTDKKWAFDTAIRECGIFVIKKRNISTDYKIRFHSDI